MPLGLYISVPFCRTKCSYCNFASDVFSKGAFENYVARVVGEIANWRPMVAGMGCPAGWTPEEAADSIYLGGGTPSILEGTQLLRIFGALRDHFTITPDAEVTVECAPGTLTPRLIETLRQCGVNRVSLGVQSFVDREAQAVGRLHTRATVLEEIGRLREAGIDNINLDLIAGLPHQTGESWAFSIAETIAAGVPHASVYMLEIDDESRLGRELLAGGVRYHAHFVPDDDATADFYQQACERFTAAGIEQYEISNFARVGAGARKAGSVRQNNESRHNLKYWTRQPYLGFGVDAHSMLAWEGAISSDCAARAPLLAEAERGVRWANPDSLDGYMNGAPLTVTRISAQAAIEESVFLGLRLNRGIELERIPNESWFRGGNELGGAARVTIWQGAVQSCLDDGLLEPHGTIRDAVRLTARGRLLSNEVFARFLIQGENGEATKVGSGSVNPR